MLAIKIILIVIASVVGLALAVGGVVFWRGWFYAARHRAQIIAEIERRDSLVRETNEILNKVSNIEIKEGEQDNE